MLLLRLGSACCAGQDASEQSPDGSEPVHQGYLPRHLYFIYYLSRFFGPVERLQSSAVLRRVPRGSQRRHRFRARIARHRPIAPRHFFCPPPLAAPPLLPQAASLVRISPYAACHLGSLRFTSRLTVAVAGRRWWWAGHPLSESLSLAHLRSPQRRGAILPADCVLAATPPRGWDSTPPKGGAATPPKGGAATPPKGGAATPPKGGGSLSRLGGGRCAGDGATGRALRRSVAWCARCS